MWFKPAGGRKTPGESPRAPAARDEKSMRRSVSKEVETKMASNFQIAARFAVLSVFIRFIRGQFSFRQPNPKWLRIFKSPHGWRTNAADPAILN
jgi:hypothetical protein